LKISSKAQELLSDLSDRDLNSFPVEPIGIPLSGSVAAGVPVEAVENAESLSLSSCFGTGDDIFALEVKGDSMIDEDIRQGDYVICRRSPSSMRKMQRSRDSIKKKTAPACSPPTTIIRRSTPTTAESKLSWSVWSESSSPGKSALIIDSAAFGPNQRSISVVFLPSAYWRRALRETHAQSHS
jgi:hypothetical protein